MGQLYIMYPIGYDLSYEIFNEKTSFFNKWLSKIKDRAAKKAILMRIMRAENGNLEIPKLLGRLCKKCGSLSAKVIESISLYVTIKSLSY